MTKRKHLPDPDTVSDDGSEDACEITARDVVAKQKKQQLRRQSAANTSTKKAKSSVWTTVAAVQVEIGSSKFMCKICDRAVITNQDLSSSNITSHYRKEHKHAHAELTRLNEQGASEEMLRNVVVEARKTTQRPVRGANIKCFFRSSGEDSSTLMKHKEPTDEVEVPLHTLQAVAAVLYTCVTENSISKVASPITQGLVDVFGGRMKYSSKEIVESFLVPTYDAVCRFLRSEANSASAGCVTLDGWSAALGAPVLGVTWHFVDDD